MFEPVTWELIAPSGREIRNSPTVAFETFQTTSVCVCIEPALKSSAVRVSASMRGRTGRLAQVMPHCSPVH